METFWQRYRGIVAAIAITAVVVLGALNLARRPEPRPLAVITPLPRPSVTPVQVTVDVRGAVVVPGLYTLSRGSRVQDALQAAGGPSTEANLEKVNLAKLLSDGEQVVIPARPPTVTPTLTRLPTATASPTDPAATPQATVAASPTVSRAIALPTARGKVNLNTASLAELDTLPGIGPALGQRIIDYRQENGPFKAIEEIKNIKGIGEIIFAQIKDLITVE